MTAVADASPRGRSEKSRARRDQLAESALTTLGELGYARTSLREIAQHSEFSHGVVHYYFSDKTELIIYCIRHYKAHCVTRYDEVVERSETPEELVEGFAAKLAETIQTEAPMHRLWYDFRTQAMFEDDLRTDAIAIDETLEHMVGRVLERYAELAGRPLAIPVATAYPMLDGVFEQALLRHLAGEPGALERLSATARAMLPRLLAD
ncbi:TetR/AcrR family transcriptional regulator [Actinomycetota bacterium]